MTSDNSQEEISALKNQFFTLLVALIVVSGTLTTVLYNQTSQATKDIDQGQRAFATINQTETNMADFLRKLLAYSEKHPDFKTVLTKNGITPASVPAAAPKK